MEKIHKKSEGGGLGGEGGWRKRRGWGEGRGEGRREMKCNPDKRLNNIQFIIIRK